MKLAILGAGGGLGRNVVDAARSAGHEVVALVRDEKRADLPADVTVVSGDATRSEDLVRAMQGTAATMFCVNPSFANWMTAFPPLLEAAVAGARQTGSRLVFPANVWIYGPGRSGETIDERRMATPTSRRGALRAQMEQQLRDAGIRYSMLRLPEYYGPSVVTLTARVFRAALAGRLVLWPGRPDAAIELVYMPDAAAALVAIAAAPDCDAEVFHLSGAQTTARHFAELVYAQAGKKARVAGVAPWVLSAAGAFDATLRGAADIAHLWTDPVLLDGTKYRTRFGELPCTPLEKAVATTFEWHRARPDLRLQA